MLPCPGHRLQAIDSRPHLINRLRGRKLTGTHTISFDSESSPYTPLAHPDQTPRLSALLWLQAPAALRLAQPTSWRAMDRPLLSLSSMPPTQASTGGKARACRRSLATSCAGQPRRASVLARSTEHREAQGHLLLSSAEEPSSLHPDTRAPLVRQTDSAEPPLVCRTDSKEHTRAQRTRKPCSVSLSVLTSVPPAVCASEDLGTRANKLAELPEGKGPRAAKQGRGTFSNPRVCAS